MKGKTIALGGDGRYFNKEAVQIILKLAAGAGIKKVSVECSLYVQEGQIWPDLEICIRHTAI